MGLLRSEYSMVYTKFVEIGRVAMISNGKQRGRLVVILDVINQTTALVDGPISPRVRRQAMNFKFLQLTNFKVKIPPSAREKTVKKAWEKAEITKQWKESPWCKKLEQKELRTKLNDFDRFKLYKARQARNRIINSEFKKLKKKDPLPKKAAAALEKKRAIRTARKQKKVLAAKK